MTFTIILKLNSIHISYPKALQKGILLSVQKVIHLKQPSLSRYPFGFLEPYATLNKVPTKYHDSSLCQFVFKSVWGFV